MGKFWNIFCISPLSYLVTFTAMVLVLKNTLLMLTFSNIREFTQSFCRIEMSGTVFHMILSPACAKELSI